MNQLRDEQPAVIAEDRRRKIVERVLKQGSVTVNELADTLKVGGNTIRRDLDVLDREGRLRRSYGGAVALNTASPRPPYSQTRNEYLLEKSWIGEAAVSYVPAAGSVFLGSGSTTYQLATRWSPESQIRVLTNSLEIALCLVSGGLASVDFPGGNIQREGLESDMSMSREILDGLYWDVTIMGVEAIDLARGITALDRAGADLQRMIIQHGGRVIILCDSSKLNRFAYARVGPVSMIDVLITDPGISPETIRALNLQGVEVVVAAPQDQPRQTHPPIIDDSD